MFLRREKVVHKLEQQVTLRGQSRSTLQNFIRRIALFVIHFGKLPEKIDPEEINEYLAALARDPGSPSQSSFKHMVYEEVNLHSLRHSYVTHLLEQRLNIVTLKELPGHADITTTMIYLHVAQCPLIWEQNLSLHPHIHCLVLAAGYSMDGTLPAFDGKR